MIFERLHTFESFGAATTITVAMKQATRGISLDVNGSMSWKCTVMSIGHAVRINMSGFGTASGKRLLATGTNKRHSEHSEQRKLDRGDGGGEEGDEKMLDEVAKPIEEEFELDD